MAPTSCVSDTWVPPQGWLSMDEFSPMQTRLTRPSPMGGRTFLDLTMPGLAASSASVIHWTKIGWFSSTSFISFDVTSSLSIVSVMSKSTRLSSSPTAAPVIG